MKQGQTLWTRDELILAINLYCKIPFGKMHKGTIEVKELASIINRTPSAVARKLGNFASFDPTLQERGVKGLRNTGALDEKVWNEFYNNWDAALLESEYLLANKKNTTIEELNELETENEINQGLDVARLVKTRINQSLFRKIILAAYNYSCCITGIDNVSLLTASHIVGWSKDEKNRLNPANGLCLNALHDKAFDNGLITISAEDYTLHVSSKLKTKIVTASIQMNFHDHAGKVISIPDKFVPGKEFLKVHNDLFKP
jgi:putative restriction endonuclease